MSILNAIHEKKKERVSRAKSGKPLAELKAAIKDLEQPRDFKKAIQRGSDTIRLIAEIKKASPSKGVIRTEFSHIDIARIYETKKVDAISVITEEDFFQGRLDFLTDVKKATTRPVLRKDFIIDEYQIYEARAHSADAVLLIAAMLDYHQAAEYFHLSRELGLAVLFEVHDHQEVETALTLNVPIIGVNNRNLKTMQVDLNTTIALKKAIPAGRISVGESGIKTRDDVLRLEDAGIDAMLIGTSFMEALDIGKKIDELLARR